MLITLFAIDVCGFMLDLLCVDLAWLVILLLESASLLALGLWLCRFTILTDSGLLSYIVVFFWLWVVCLRNVFDCGLVFVADCRGLGDFAVWVVWAICLEAVVRCVLICF